MKAILLNIILFTFTLTSFSYAQVYELKANEKIAKSYILSENNYAFILEVKNQENSNIQYDIVHNQNRLTEYKESGILKILDSGVLVASMLKASVAKDMWFFIYNDTEFEFDTIEGITFSDNNSSVMMFAKKLDVGFVIVDGEYQDYNYDTLFDYSITSKRYAYSYMRDDLYYINIDGVEMEIMGEAQKITFSDDSTRLAYVLINEGTETIIVNDEINEVYSMVDEITFANNNLIAYTAKMLPPAPETNNSTNDNTNETTTIIQILSEDKNLSNRPLIKNNNKLPENYEGIVVIGPSDTIALINTNETEPLYLYDILTEEISNQEQSNTNSTNYNSTNINTNDSTMTSVFLEKTKFYEYENISDLSFSPNSKTLTFIFKENDEYYLSQSGNTNRGYSEIITYKYSPNSENIVLGVDYEDKNNIILNTSTIYSVEMLYDIYYSDSILALSVEKNGKKFIYSTDFESPAYTEIISFKFSDNGNAFALTAKRFDKYYQFSFNKKNPKREESSSYDYISSVFLSNETSNFLTLALKENKIYLLKNGLKE